MFLPVKVQTEFPVHKVCRRRVETRRKLEQPRAGGGRKRKYLPGGWGKVTARRKVPLAGCEVRVFDRAGKAI